MRAGHVDNEADESVTAGRERAVCERERAGRAGRQRAVQERAGQSKRRSQRERAGGEPCWTSERVGWKSSAMVVCSVLLAK